MQRKAKLTVTVDKEIVAALPALKAKLEELAASDELADLVTLYGLPRITTSALVQMGLSVLLVRNGVELPERSNMLLALGSMGPRVEP